MADRIKYDERHPEIYYTEESIDEFNARIAAIKGANQMQI